MSIEPYIILKNGSQLKYSSIKQMLQAVNIHKGEHIEIQLKSLGIKLEECESPFSLPYSFYE